MKVIPFFKWRRGFDGFWNMRRKMHKFTEKKEDKRQVFWTFFLNFLVIKNNLVLISHTLYLIKLLNVEELHEKLIRLGDFWLILWFIFSCYFLFLDVYWRQKWINFYFEPRGGGGEKSNSTLLGDCQFFLYWN